VRLYVGKNKEDAVKPHVKWEVLPHGRLELVAETLWSVTGEMKMPLGKFVRRMTIAKLRNGKLVIYSAIALHEAEMAQLDALGEPAFLVVPSGIHRLDARPWKDRYPNVVVIAPAGARERIGEVLSIDATSADIGDPDVRIFAVPGTKDRELAMVAGKTLVLNDLIFNLPKMSGIAQWLYKLAGFGPGHPTIPKLVAKKLVADREAVSAQLRRWANDGFERLIVAHGEPIENPRETLLALAA
jgi:hypothetical protein